MARPDRLIRQCLRERFVLTLKTKETFEGLLLEVDEKTVILADGYALDGSSRLRVDGNLYIPRTEVSYMQRPEVRG